MNTLTYDVGELDPNAHLTTLDDTGAVIDLSTGYTWAVSVIDSAGTVAHTQSTGATGSSTAPNITIVWATGFGSVAVGRYKLKVVGTKASRPRVWMFGLVVE